MNLKPRELKSLKITVVFLCLLFVACFEDRRKEYEPYNGVQKWMEGIMRKDYYWYKEMPDAKGLNFLPNPLLFSNPYYRRMMGNRKTGRIIIIPF
ncbi:hypothetical protein EZS27_011173 [termite gut metagenome]|uniref:Peptidase S41 N-terminal domain-containing protein n=1 Tax=termite gut metagenome TaxID=433724 RepID=A0A5J4S5B2_9ZZZZ